MWLINLLGLALIAAIVWWFWLYRPVSTQAGDAPIDIVVADGVYQPAHITVSAHTPVTLRFLRKDPSPCAEIVRLDDFDISEQLPLNKHKDVVLTPDKPGRYDFTCQMRMYRGVLEVTN